MFQEGKHGLALGGEPGLADGADKGGLLGEGVARLIELELVGGRVALECQRPGHAQRLQGGDAGCDIHALVAQCGRQRVHRRLAQLALVEVVGREQSLQRPGRRLAHGRLRIA